MIRFLCAVLALCSVAATTRAAPPAIADFFAPPTFSNPKLSPDGGLLAVVVLIKNQENLALLDLKTMQIQPAAHFDGASLVNYWWKRDGELLLLIENLENGGGDFRSFNVHTRKINFLSRLNARNASRIVSALPDDPENVLVSTSIGNGYDLRRVNIVTGQSTVVEQNLSNVDSWIVNEHGQAMAALGRVNKAWFAFLRKSRSEKWERVELGSNDLPRYSIKTVHPDQRRLLCWEFPPSGTNRVVALDPATRETELVFQSPDVDARYVTYWGDAKAQPKAIAYETDRPRFHYLTTDAAALGGQLERTLPDTVNDVISQSTDGQVMVILAQNDQDQGVYFLLNRREGRMVALGATNPLLRPEALGKSRAFDFEARDGLKIHGRLFLPPKTSAAPPPLLLMVGPDLNGFQSGFQFDVIGQSLASRGYAVARIDYRGTANRGREFESAGDKQIGTGMPADLEDGVAWLRSQGLVDQRRAGIVGVSFGGIVALHAVTRSNLFQAWVNINTPMSSDWLGYSDLAFGELKKEDALPRLGGRKEANRYAESIDPFDLLAKVRCPSFQYYYKRGDALLVNDGGRAMRFFKASSQPHVLVEGSYVPPRGLNGTEYRVWVRAKNVEYHTAVVDFLEKYFPVNAP